MPEYNDSWLLFPLDAVPKQNLDITTDVDFMRTPRSEFAVVSNFAKARYLFWDDIIGDPLL